MNPTPATNLSLNPVCFNPLLNAAVSEDPPKLRDDEEEELGRVAEAEEEEVEVEAVEGRVKRGDFDRAGKGGGAMRGLEVAVDMVANGDMVGGHEEDGDEERDGSDEVEDRGEGVECFGGRGGSEGGSWISTGDREEDLIGS